ncbi:MAG: EAL domain-containing protein, partial [Usitatibacter sp.]
MKEHVSEIRQDAAGQLRKVLDERSLATVFQPIFGFREGRMLGFEALVRGPANSLLQTPFELFSAAQECGLALELNIVCVQEILRAFARRNLEGSLFLNISPQLIMQRGFDQERAARFMQSLGIEPARVVIELTEDYPTVDFRFVHESLMLYRAMGFRVAIDDLGEGFASLRLWSELKPEF